MKLPSGSQTAKKSKKIMRVATVFTGAAACLASFAPAAFAKTSSSQTTNTGTVPAGDHRLKIVMSSQIGDIYACEYTGGRHGILCSAYPNPDYQKGKLGTIYTWYLPEGSKGQLLYSGHIMLAWSGKASRSQVIKFYSPKRGFDVSFPQSRMTANPGQWNQCTLAKSGSLTVSVFAENGLGAC
jgi:hypothetical protein